MSADEQIKNLYSAQNKVQLFRAGTSFFKLLEQLINNAKQRIYIKVYIWKEDDTGNLIARLLMEASKRKVAVYVMADGYASQGLSDEFVLALRKSGVHFKFFEPLLRSTNFYFGRRMHEKVVVVDGMYATVAGINFADHYNSINNSLPWLDYALYVEGDAAYDLDSICKKDWKDHSFSLTKPTLTSIGQQYSVRIRQNDWVKGKQNIWKTYFHWFNQSKESITIMSSYFLPGRVLMNRLSAASSRGVKVKVVLAGPSDVMTAKYAERYLYRWMLRNNIEIYEYQPTVLHAKLMVVDNHFVTIGSYNVNNISTYASTELNLDVRNRDFAKEVQHTIDFIIKNDCVIVDKHSAIIKVGIGTKFVQMIAYYLIRLMLNVSTFYFKQE